MFDSAKSREIWDSLLSDILSDGNEHRKLQVLLQATLLGCIVLAAVAVFGIVIVYTKHSCTKKETQRKKYPPLA